MSRARSLSPVALVVAFLGGCNFVIGTEDREVYPETCGAESLTSARFSFSDDRNGHCYSLVQSEEEMGTDFVTAKDSCTLAGGMLACVNDAEELALIGRNVPTDAWLGMNSLRVGDLSRYECIDGELFQPDFVAWADGHPTSDGGGACSILRNGQVTSRGCGARQNEWLCELAPNGEE